ncbi:MAG TPA: Gfo/Idh/MocA family oxidoreductase [Pseudonocardia sp.]|nr:Gfo/Idh/MocA family oxidoreductase [Pseudonocardia sp.]
MAQVRIAVAGAGLIGRRHIEEIVASDAARLAAVVDPSAPAAELAAGLSVPLHSSLAELFAVDRPDGVILATPNRMHVDGGLECVAAGVPVIVEKPLGDTVEGARTLVEAAAAAGVPLLTGHHRNYSSIMAKAREAISSGVLGRLVGVVGTATFCKPDDYFDVGGGWRRQPGGGPILLNLTHEVNNLMALCGDIVAVQATTTNATRGFPVEDTAAMIFQFANGALGTFLLSDTAASPRSWEQTSGENASYASYPDEDCYHLFGTRGSLSIPTMRLKTYPGAPSWWSPTDDRTLELEVEDPLANQVAHFAAVIRGEAEPICSGQAGLNTLLVCDAVVRAAASGERVDTGVTAG